VADQYYEDALERIEDLLKKIEGVRLPVATAESTATVEEIQDYMGSVAEKLITLRDRMTGEEGNYTVGGG